MSPDTLSLPNQPPPNEPELEPSDEVLSSAPQGSPSSAEDSSDPHEAPQRKEPAAPARPAAAAPRPAAKPPAAEAAATPGMPGQPQPGDGVDDDDDDIPEEDLFEEEYEEEAPEPETGGILAGTVVSTREDGVFVDIGRKSEAFLPMGNRRGESKKVELNVGDRIDVTVTGQSSEGYLLLATSAGRRPADWSHLEVAFDHQHTIVGKVTELIKGGLSVDVGARAFLPASRSGTRDAEELETLVGQEIECRITQLDIESQNIVVDRRVVIEEQRNSQRQEAISGLVPGAVVSGVVRNIQKFGAFVDLGGVDALLHISDLSWGRVKNVTDVVAEGQEFDVKILKIEDGGKRISVGLKQLTPDPWTAIAEKLAIGDRVKGRVTRLKDFGAFVEIEPGVEGLVHVSEMSWARRVRHPEDLVKIDDMVDAVVLDIKQRERRIALGLKQALGDPWDRAETECPPGTVMTGVVRKLARFGAFIEIMEGVEGLLHISDISSERRLNHPSEELKEGGDARVVVLEFDRAKKRLKLGMKQLSPSAQEEFLEAINPGDTITGRVVSVQGTEATVELDEGVRGVCRFTAPAASKADVGEAAPGSNDVGSMSERLKAAWGSGGSQKPASALGDLFQAGQVRSFRVASIDAESGKIELAPA